MYRRWNMNYTEPTIYSASGIDGIVRGFLEHFSYTVTGLQSNKHYTFRLTAINAGGTSEISDSAWMGTGNIKSAVKHNSKLNFVCVVLTLYQEDSLNEVVNRNVDLTCQ